MKYRASYTISSWRRGGALKHGDVDIEIDAYAVAKEIGPRALSNKTGRATALKGAIVVKVRKEKRNDSDDSES